MAIPTHLEMLRSGPSAWNAWRKTHSDIKPDLTNADLRGMNLRGIGLGNANLRRTDLSGTDLSPADLSPADPRVGETWTDDTQIRAGEYWEDSMKISLGHTDLRDADLRFAKLTSTSLMGTILTDADLTCASLDNALFDGATFGGTVFCNVDLRSAGLTDLRFRSPCTVDLLTLRKLTLPSQKPNRQSELESFLRGCGLNDWEIEAARLHDPSLTAGQINDILYRIHGVLCSQSIQISPLFISYNHEDGLFVDQLESHLNHAGIRFWRDIHHATAGRLERQVDRAIRLNPTVLLILSEHSVNSDWVEHEARTARKLEIEIQRDVLCPIALDSSWENSRWPDRLREQLMEYKILDFSAWQDPESLRRAFEKLVEGLGLFYAKQDGA